MLDNMFYLLIIFVYGLLLNYPLVMVIVMAIVFMGRLLVQLFYVGRLSAISSFLLVLIHFGLVWIEIDRNHAHFVNMNRGVWFASFLVEYCIYSLIFYELGRLIGELIYELIKYYKQKAKVSPENEHIDEQIPKIKSEDNVIGVFIKSCYAPLVLLTKFEDFKRGCDELEKLGKFMNCLMLPLKLKKNSKRIVKSVRTLGKFFNKGFKCIDQNKEILDKIKQNAKTGLKKKKKPGKSLSQKYTIKKISESKDDGPVDLSGYRPGVYEQPICFEGSLFDLNRNNLQILSTRDNSHHVSVFTFF